METLYRSLVEYSPDIIYVLDQQARVVFINDTVEKLLGYEKKDLIGRELIGSEFVVEPARAPHFNLPWPTCQIQSSSGFKVGVRNVICCLSRPFALLAYASFSMDDGWFARQEIKVQFCDVVSCVKDQGYTNSLPY